MSLNFYDRMLFIRSCEILFELFSTHYFKEFFFFKTVQLFGMCRNTSLAKNYKIIYIFISFLCTGDPVANIRLAMCKMIPKLKCMLKLPNDRKLSAMLNLAIQKCQEDKDKEVVRCLLELKHSNLEYNKVFP